MTVPGSWTRCYAGTVAYSEPGYTEVRLPDGAVVRGRPHHTIEYRARALSLGYRDAEGMCQEHDPMHALLAAALGLQESPALRAAADGVGPSEVTDAEEAMVLAAQRFLQLARRAGLALPYAVGAGAGDGAHLPGDSVALGLRRKGA